MSQRIAASELPEQSAVAPARAATRRWLDDQGITGADAEHVVLVVSELVTNAVRHARSGFTLDLDRTQDGVRIEVFDMDSRQPALMGADTDATSGRGLQIVADVADDWGSHTEARDGIPGKIVWAELTWPREGQLG